MSFSIRTYAALISLLALALGAAALGTLIPSLVGAQAYSGSTSQIVITTQPGVGISALPNSTVTVTASGPSLTGTPTSVGSLTYNTNFANDTKVITVIPGPYFVTAAPAGYFASYSSGCSGLAIGGQTHTCTIIATTYTDTSARLTVSVNVLNSRGGTLIPGNVQVTVSGTNPSPANFTGTIGGTVVNLGPGIYSVNAPSLIGYSSSLSGACSGTIASGESRSCSVTYSDTNIGPYSGYTGTLICTPLTQNASLGQTVTFQAYGGLGTYTWKTADRTFINIGPALTTSLQTAGPQTVLVTSGGQTATCTVNVSGIYSYGNPTYYSGGYVLGASTGPGFPNTGFEPIDWTGLALAMLSLLVAGVFLYAYAPKLSLAR